MKLFLCFGPIMFQELTRQPGLFILTFVFNSVKLTLVLSLWYTSQPIQLVQVLAHLTCTHVGMHLLQLGNSQEFLLVATNILYLLILQLLASFQYLN